MKLICISRAAGEEAAFYLRPDTALLRNNQPFYYPDFTDELCGELCFVLRVCRTGRSIGERFAARYLNAAGIGLLLTAADIRRRCIKHALPWDAATGFDYSAALSPEFIALDKLPNWNCELKVDNEAMPVMPFDFNGVTKTVIPMVSQFLTLKIGDYIFVPISQEFPLQRGQTVAAFWDGRELLHVDVR